MCYKQEKYRQLEINLVKKMKDVPEFIKNFFNRYKSRTSRNCYWGYIKDLLMWLIRKDYIKKNNISEITESDINKISSDNIISYLEALEMGIDCRKNSLESINSKKKVFNSFWEYMETEGYVDKNVVRHISNDRFKSEKTDKEVKIPTQEEIDEFLTNISKGNNNEFNIIRNLAIVNLFLGSGIRSEELINLDIPDLFLHEDKPYIKVLGKGNIQNYDNVPISEKAKDYLLEYLEYRTEFVKLNKIDNNAVFLSNSKKRMSKTAITSFFDTYSDGKINPHMLRHWVGTELFKKTRNILVAQAQLRHKNSSTTTDYYVHKDKNEQQNAVFTL